MEWLTGRAGASATMEVDIGHVSRMELRSAAPSVNQNETGISSDQLLTAMDDKLYASLLASFQWTDENVMSEREALDLLERKFYPFKEVRCCFSQRKGSCKSDTAARSAITNIVKLFK